MAPRQWMFYSASNLIIKFERSRQPSKFKFKNSKSNRRERIKGHFYQNRSFNNPRIVDKSLGKIGRKHLCNWAGMTLDNVTFDWLGKTLTDDFIRKT